MTLQAAAVTLGYCIVYKYNNPTVQFQLYSQY